MDVPWKFLITQFGLILFMLQQTFTFKQSGKILFNYFTVIPFLKTNPKVHEGVEKRFEKTLNLKTIS